VPERAPYYFAPAPIRDAVVDLPGRLLTAAWRNWFIQFSEQFLFRWDDLRFPATGFNPAGSTAPPTISTSTGLLGFSGVADNIIGGVAQMPHAWARGTEIHPHIHLRFPTSAVANTRWRLDYDVASVGGNFTHASGTYTALAAVTVANPQNVLKHVYAELGVIPMTGHTESAIVVWRLTRLAATDVLDDDANACELHEFDIHYQSNKWGTPSELPT
jgi:hypothetical protein